MIKKLVATMLGRCIVKECKNSRVSFQMLHEFPRSEAFRNQWMIALGVEQHPERCSRVSKHSKICSEHFRESDFSAPIIGTRRRLKKNCIPSVFPWSPPPVEEEFVVTIPTRIYTHSGVNKNKRLNDNSITGTKVSESETFKRIKVSNDIYIQSNKVVTRDIIDSCEPIETEFRFEVPVVKQEIEIEDRL